MSELAEIGAYEYRENERLTGPLIINMTGNPSLLVGCNIGPGVVVRAHRGAEVLNTAFEPGSRFEYDDETRARCCYFAAGTVALPIQWDTIRFENNYIDGPVDGPFIDVPADVWSLEVKV